LIEGYLPLLTLYHATFFGICKDIICRGENDQLKIDFETSPDTQNSPSLRFQNFLPRTNLKVLKMAKTGGDLTSLVRHRGIVEALFRVLKNAL